MIPKGGNIQKKLNKNGKRKVLWKSFLETFHVPTPETFSSVTLSVYREAITRSRIYIYGFAPFV
jgi:hypothetical protein